MNIRKKIAIAVGSLIVIGGIIVAFVLEVYDDSPKGYKTYQTTANGNDTTSINNTASGTNSPFTDSEGKVSEVSDSKITIEVPLQGTKTFTIDKNTKIEDLFLPLKNGVLVDVHANGEIAYLIETERTVDAYGTIVKITDQDVTINYNGTDATYAKASNFRIETDDGYQGALEGLPAEIAFNDQLQIISLEIDTDVDYDD